MTDSTNPAPNESADPSDESLRHAVAIKLQAATGRSDENIAQLMNYLTATAFLDAAGEIDPALIATAASSMAPKTPARVDSSDVVAAALSRMRTGGGGDSRTEIQAKREETRTRAGKKPKH